MRRWLAAWNSHQPERLLELMTDDIVYGDSASSQTMRGQGQQAAPAGLIVVAVVGSNARVAISVAMCRASGRC